MNKSIKLVVLIILFITVSLGCHDSHSLTYKQVKSKEKIQTKPALPFKIGEKFFYQVRFNGVRVGKIEFEYKGRMEIGKIYQDIISLNSDVKILKLFQIESKETVYVEKNTCLPLKVEREVRFLGKDEEILEEYNQKEGWIKITQIKGRTTEERLIKVSPPIHNALILYFLYPLDLKDQTIGKTLEFNLPLRRISIKIKEKRMVATDGGRQELYILEGSPQRFKLWLKQDERPPLRIEIPVFLGKVSITKT